MPIVTSLPKDDQGCGWYHTSPQRVPRPSHKGELRTRWAVIGAGLTGLAAARQLATRFPSDQVTLIEAQQVGFGSSGRNAGFAIDLPHDVGAADYIGDIVTARSVLELNRFGQHYLQDVVDTHNIACHMRACGKYQAAVEDRGIKILDAYRRGLERLQEPCDLINAEALHDILGTGFHQKALFTPGTRLLQPAALVKGLADTLPDNVTLYENTPITHAEFGDRATLRHAKGSVIADKLLLTNNAFAMQFGFLRNRMIPVFTYGSLTRQLTEEEQKRLGGQDFWGVIPADPIGTTLRRTHDQRLFVRNSFKYIADGRARENVLPRFAQRHRDSLDLRFPMLKGLEFEYTWGGALAMSRNHQSFFGELAPHIYGALCCNGLGVTRGTAMGVLLANWLAGDRDALIEFLKLSPGTNRNPPAPILHVGVTLNLALAQLRAGKAA